MFRKFKESIYVKAAFTMLVSGGILIMFNNWVKHTQFSVGFETINNTLAPIYIGMIFAFILCPVYNASVKFIYATMLRAAKKRAFSVGTTLVIEERDELPVDKAEKRGLLTFARALSSLLCVIIVVGLVGLIFYFVVPQVVQNGITLIDTLPERLATLSQWVQEHFQRFPIIITWVDNIAASGTEDIVKWIQKYVLSGNAMSIATMISSGVYVAIKYVANAFIGLLIMIYLLNYKERLFAIARKIISATCGQKRQNSLYEFANVVNETFVGFIVGRIIDSFIIGVLTYVTLKVCGIQFALMISVIVGVTNIIPFFGPFIGAIPSVFILMLEEPMQALYFIIIILIIQQLDGNVIGPKIVGNAIGIGSFWVLIAVLIGGGLFGFGGMAFGVPVFAVIYRYVDKLTMLSLKSKDRATQTADYFNLETYGIDEKEIELETGTEKKNGLFKLRRRKPKNRAD